MTKTMTMHFENMMRLKEVVIEDMTEVRPIILLGRHDRVPPSLCGDGVYKEAIMVS